MDNVSLNFTGSVPHYYEKGLVPVIFADYAREMAARAAKLKPGKVLELAAGTGVVTRMLRDELSPGCEITASDLNVPMLEIAKTKFTSDEAVSFQAIDAMDISLPDKSMDLVLCQFGVMFFPDKIASYKEARRVLKRGGRYIFNAWGSHSENPFAAIGQSLVEELFPTDTPQFYNVPFHYHDPKQMKRDMKAAGFSGVKVKPLPIKKVIQSVDDFVEGFVYGNPLAEQIVANNGDPAELARKLKEAYLKEFKGNPPKMPICAYFVSGKK